MPWNNAGRQTGLLGNLERHEADMAFCAISMGPERQMNFDFTPSLHQGRLTLYRVVPERVKPKVQGIPSIVYLLLILLR